MINLDDKQILVTGGTGSFGRAFARHVLNTSNPRRLVVFSRDEQKQYDMANELPPSKYEAMRYFIGDVRDRDRVEMAMRGIDYVVHAAAMKHVPAAEYNPFECIQTNVHGAENIVHAAIREGVERVIALSTDKAANPVNLYGASKLAADKIFVAANHLSGHGGTSFSVVRYGNVVGSRGSVIPFFKRLIEEGTASLPATDPAMTRFVITLQDGVRFVLDSLELMRAGEIFVPKLPSVRLSDLIEAMAPGLAIETIGIRPGEKVHEVLISEDDARSTVDHGERYIIEPSIRLYEYKTFANDGHALVANGFRYSSDANETFLDVDGIRALLTQEALMPGPAA